ncbi:MAG: response regulator transcription factor [Oscillospiraceae bacterium]|nr:response regulator transcription factor [Oscillospiraceae bacterium]
MSNNKYKVLIVEDDRNISNFIQTVLEANGYQALSAERCQQGLLVFASHIPDLVVLDLGLPDMDGEDFIRMVRAGSTVPIIVLSARSEERDKVTALDLGANDYITKPFGTAELMARVRAALRSSRHPSPVAAPSSTFALKDLLIDYDRRQVSVGGNLIHLTQTEYNILAFLSQHIGKVMTYSAIIRSVWGSMDDGSIKKLQVNMANIRKKLGCRPGDNRYVINELGVGYRMLEE